MINTDYFDTHEWHVYEMGREAGKREVMDHYSQSMPIYLLYIQDRRDSRPFAAFSSSAAARDFYWNEIDDRAPVDDIRVEVIRYYTEAFK